MNRKVRQLQATMRKQQAQLEMVTKTVADIQNSGNDDEGSNNAGVGSTYVRWGRTVCPDTAELVYEGL